MTFWSNK